MNDTFLSWVFFVGYCSTIAGIAFYNSRKAKTLQSFSIGTRNVNPFFIGLSLAANMTSAATFVINPGLVYAYGLAGFVGYALATPLGITIGLIVLSKSFRTIGDQFSVITVPNWIGSRFADKRFTIYLSIVSLLQITFLVLITVGLAVVLSNVLQIGVIVSLLIVILFTFTYIIFGGASAHVWTNTIQAIIMIIVAFILLGSGLSLFSDGIGVFFDRLNAVGPHYGSITNPDSKLFRDFFETVICNFIIGIAIITQPHIISKSLFLRTEKDVNRYLTTAIIVESLFFALLFVGLYARLLLDGAPLPVDRVISTYIVEMFSPTMRSVIMLGVLAAGFSTMEGILLSLSTIFSNDFVNNVFPVPVLPAEGEKHRLLKISKIFLAILAPVTFVLSYDQILHPSISVALFAQNGVYGLFSATFIPVLLGIFVKKVNKNVVFIASLTALAVHFGMFYGEITMYYNNPAVTAACALFASTIVAAAGMIFTKNSDA
ncbi:MAG: sodium:solute symporter [Bacteroidota bacterium]|jgi:SSS family solute:Na+ symporter/sodium/pantothenate symporter